jgi:hypothetical protein
LLPALADEGEIGRLVSQIRAVGPEGQGNDRAARAWRGLARQTADAMPDILAGFDGADPVAANWLGAAVDAIAERETQAGRPLPALRLEAFVKDRKHAPEGRRLAYEWLARIDSAAPGRLLPGLLDDPSPDLRRQAVAAVVRQAESELARGHGGSARTAFQKAFAQARDPDQVEALAKTLKGLGETVDLAAHYGFLRRWHLIGPFDNTGGNGFETAFGPEKSIDLGGVLFGKAGKEVRWIEHTTNDPLGKVDLNQVFGKSTGACAYAHTVVELPESREIELRAASENALRIFVNGPTVFSREEYHHGRSFDQHIVRVKLQKGRNTILVKVCQDEEKGAWAQAWDFQLRVCDAVGSPVPLKILGQENKP